MSGTWLSPDSLRSLAEVVVNYSGTSLGADAFLRSCAVLPEDVPELVSAYRLGGLAALGAVHGALFGERGWSFLAPGSRHSDR